VTFKYKTVKICEFFKLDNYLKTGLYSYQMIRNQDGQPFDNLRPFLPVIECFRLSSIQILDVDCI
jgi:hypothetical protein